MGKHRLCQGRTPRKYCEAGGTAAADERARRPTVALMYRVTPRLAVDAGMRTTLTGQGPDWSAFIGLSVRLWR